jgi:hypothetical protein
MGFVGMYSAYHFIFTDSHKAATGVTAIGMPLCIFYLRKRG